MEKTHDYIHEYFGYWSPGAKCRIRIYQEDGEKPVVICSELPENENTSVTNLAEVIAAEVMLNHELLPGFIWIEHYPDRRPNPSFQNPIFDEHFDVVTFASYGVEWRHSYAMRKARPRLGQPDWKRVKKTEVEALVEQEV